MSSLFIDSTYDVTLGLLDEDFKWIDFKTSFEKKASTVLQSQVYNLFESQGLKVKDIKSVFTVAGPGFYTGLRVSEGLADVFKFFNIPHYSFYSYEIPAWLGHSAGAWVTKAYRGEYFFHEWDESKSRNNLMTSKDLESFEPQALPYFIHSPSALDSLSLKHFANATSTLELLQKEPGIIFKNILENHSQRDSFYFRAPEDEFRVNP